MTVNSCQPPSTPLRDALRVVECDIGAHHQIPYGPGGEDLPGPAIQRWIERWLLPVAGYHQTRQPLPLLRAAGFVIDRDERFPVGVIGQARRPVT